MIFSLQILVSILLDAMIGDPHWYTHPVRGIGRVIQGSERITRTAIANPYLAGLVTVLAVTGISCGIVFFILMAANSISSSVEVIVGVVLLYTTIAARDLLRHSTAVYDQLEGQNSLAQARLAVGRIVGRDTSDLDEQGVCRAAIETVAENMVDGITAPLFFAVAASFFAQFFHSSPLSCAVLGAYFYKSVNTMDSMIAYKNEKYFKFGRVAAKLDDAVNFIPARISGICLIIAAFFLKLDYRKAANVFFRDRLKHSSPNAGHTEAAAAGAMGIRLGGPSFYFNKLVEKPYLGDDDNDAVPADIKMTNRLVIVGSVIFIVCLLGLRLFIVG